MSIVAIVGRPNVGKSTLFNRLIQRREAIVDAVSGVTRDRHYGKSDWNGKEFSLIDTGGYVVGSDDIFESEIDKQVELAIGEADAIIFMTDVVSGVTGMDEEVTKLLRKCAKPVFLVVNKVDSANRTNDAVEFYSLGFESLSINWIEIVLAVIISALAAFGALTLMVQLLTTINFTPYVLYRILLGGILIIWAFV